VTKKAAMVSWNDQWTTVFTDGWKRQNIQRHLYTSFKQTSKTVRAKRRITQIIAQ